MDKIIGHKIIKLRTMTDAEAKREGWEDDRERPAVLELENGVLLYPSCDSEGNGSGVLFGYDPKEKQHFGF